MIETYTPQPTTAWGQQQNWCGGSMTVYFAQNPATGGTEFEIQLTLDSQVANGTAVVALFPWQKPTDAPVYIGTWQGQPISYPASPPPATVPASFTGFVDVTQGFGIVIADAASLNNPFAVAKKVSFLPTPATAPPPPPIQPGILALATAMSTGVFQASYVTVPIIETCAFGTVPYPNDKYLSDSATAALLEFLGNGTMSVTIAPMGEVPATLSQLANALKFSNGMVVLAADVAQTTGGNPAQLISNLTATINVGSQWQAWYALAKTTGVAPPIPTYALYYTGPAIPPLLSTYPPGSIAPDGNVINPSNPGAA